VRPIEPAIDDDDAPLPEGEIVALPLPSGRPFQLSFPSPHEVFLLLDGRRVRHDEGPDTRALLIWSARRSPALWRALEEQRVLLGTLVDGEALAHDVCDREDPPTFDDHSSLRARLEPAGQKMAAFSLLGPLATKADIERRVRTIYAPGTHIELRVEDGGRVVSRRRMRVGR
jgi:hypothetical protein